MSMSSDFTLSILNNKYVLTRLLGNGGFGEVYEAIEPQLGVQRAIKVVVCETEEKRRQVLREGKLLAHYSKSWRFIPDVHDVWSEGQKTYLVMEFIGGQTLQEQLQASAHPWSADRVATFLRSLLGFLAQLHEAGIVHRDLKPANIKDALQRGYILLDFGIAKQFETYTVVKEIGTLEYAPLEQLTQGSSTDGRSDLYSLGATAYQLLTRQLPPPAYLRDSARHNGQGEILIPPGRLVRGVPPALERTLLALLALDPADRPANARAALAMLDTIPTDTVIAAPTPKRPAPHPPPLAAAPTIALRGAMPTMPLPPAAGRHQAVALDPRQTLLRRATAWWRDLWRPTSALTLTLTGLWSALGALVGWGAGAGVLAAATEARTALFPLLGGAVGAGLCAVARLLGLPRGHPAEPVAAVAGLYVAVMALVGALVGGFQTLLDPAPGGRDSAVMFGAAFAPLLGAVAFVLLHTCRDRSLDTLRRVGTGTVFVACSALLAGIALGGIVGSILWLFPQGSTGNLLSDCIVPGALGGGLVGAAIGLYLGSATLLLREGARTGG